MGGVALYGLDQVRDQVVTLLELHVDVGKGLADALAERDQAVIGAKRKQNEDDNDAENDPAGRHGKKLLVKSRMPGSVRSLLARGSRPEVGIALVGRKATFVNGR